MTTTTIQTTSSASAGGYLAWLGWLLVFAAGCYFLLDRVPAYLVWSESSYGPYFWPRAAWVLPHVLGGTLALILGPFQFMSRIRTQHPKVHRITGRIYLGAIFVAALAGMGLAVISAVDLAYASGLFMLGVAWLLTSGMALAAILRRNFSQHQQWMIRSYVVTFAFVTFRLLGEALAATGITPYTLYYPTLAWACWVVPLLLAEVVMQGRQIFTARRGGAGGAARSAA